MFVSFCSLSQPLDQTTLPGRDCKMISHPFLRHWDVLRHIALDSPVFSFFPSFHQHKFEGVGVWIPREDGRPSRFAGGVRPFPFVQYVSYPLEFRDGDADVSISSTVFGSLSESGGIWIGQFHEMHLLSISDVQVGASERQFVVRSVRIDRQFQYVAVELHGFFQVFADDRHVLHAQVRMSRLGAFRLHIEVPSPMHPSHPLLHLPRMSARSVPPRLARACDVRHRTT